MFIRLNINFFGLCLFIFFCLYQVLYFEKLGFCESTNKKIVQNVEKYKSINPSANMLKAIQKYDKYIKYFSSFAYHRKKRNVNPNYIRALICVESAGNPRAVSPAKAYGLTQILLPTGRRWAKELYKTGYDFEYIDEERLKHLTVKDLFDPAMNILLACYGTDKFNARFGGRDMVYIAASWNAGHNAVIKHKNSPPYKETINFIGKINGYILSFMKYGFSSHVPVRSFSR